MILFECVYGFPLSLMFGGHKAVISTVLWQAKIFTGAIPVKALDGLE